MTTHHDREQNMMMNFKLCFGDNTPLDHGDRNETTDTGASCHVGKFKSCGLYKHMTSI